MTRLLGTVPTNSTPLRVVSFSLLPRFHCCHPSHHFEDQMFRTRSEAWALLLRVQKLLLVQVLELRVVYGIGLSLIPFNRF